MKSNYLLSIEERRKIKLKALDPETNITHLAKEHGISRQTVYDYLDSVTDNPKEKLRKAEEEVEFWKEVLRWLDIPF
jgi:predicted regulator of amino acid metabolism with ACT domain